MNCSIIIRAYNEQEHLGRLLHGIKKQTIHDTEIILVDSGSTDMTVNIAKEFGARIVYIHPSEFTFGRSLNLGMRAATRDLVVIASAHVYPLYPDWLECLLLPFSDSKIALTYGKQRAPKTAYFSEKQVYYQWYSDSSQINQPHPFCNNANAAVRRDLWLQHLYDETLTGLEDLAWAKWATEAGYAITYVAEAEIVHIHNESSTGIFNRYRREAMAFKKIYPESSFQLFDFLQLTLSNVQSDLWHAFQDGVLFDNLFSVFSYRIMQFYGTFMGYRSTASLSGPLRKTFYYPYKIGKKKRTISRNVDAINYIQDENYRPQIKQ